MTGNKTNNGVLEIGTDEIRASYCEDTPGQTVEKFIKEREKAVHEAKDRTKKQFGAVFQNPLKGYPYNEAIKVTPIKESFEELKEALSPKDKKVIDAFYDGKDMDGKTVKSVGDKLETTGMGAQVVLKRQGSKFRIFGVVDSRRVQEIIRYIKKSYPKNTIIEGNAVLEMLDMTKARELPDNIQKEIIAAKKEYDSTWSGVFVPMGKDGSSQRKEYERRGKVFKAASAKYKALLKKHKVMSK